MLPTTLLSFLINPNGWGQIGVESRRGRLLRKKLYIEVFLYPRNQAVIAKGA
jgi:hypothetical protein